MIEKIVLEYLQTKITTPVYLEKPDDGTKKYVLIEKTGSSRENRIESAMIAIQSYAESMVDAIELNELVKSKMLDIDALPDIGSCDLNSDYNYTDEETKQYRYQAVFDITHY